MSWNQIIDKFGVPMAVFEYQKEAIHVFHVNHAWSQHVATLAETPLRLWISPIKEQLAKHFQAAHAGSSLGYLDEHELTCLTLSNQQALLIAECSMAKNHSGLYRNMIENILITSYVIEPGSPTKMLYCSPYIEALTGYEPQYFNGSDRYSALIHAQDAARVLAEVDEATDQKKPFEFSYRLHHAQGRIIWVYERGQAVFNTQGEVLYYAGTMMDVTEDKVVRSVLNRQRLLLDAILKSTRRILESDDIDDALNECFMALGSALNMGRIYLYTNTAQAGELYANLSHEWVSKDTYSVLDDPNQQHIPIASLPDFFEPLLNGKTFEKVVTDIEDAHLRAHLSAQAIKAILVFPIVVNERFYGFIGFDEVNESRAFTSLEYDYLGSFARSLATALTRHEDALTLQAQTRLFETVFEAIDSGLTVIDEHMRVLHVNQAMRRYQKAAFEPGIACQKLFKVNVASCEHCPVRFAFKHGTTATMFRQFTVDAQVIDTEIKAYPILDEQNQVRSVVQLIRNISDQKAYEMKLRSMSETDPLTGVYNRAYFESRLNRLDQEGIRAYTIVSLDVDGLKLINDTLGSVVGDDILKAVGKALKETSDPNHIVARIGGDEFAVLCESESKKPCAHIDVETIQSQLHLQFSQGDYRYPDALLSISYGSATHSDDQVALEVLRQADDAMYSQKLRKGQSAKSTIVKTLISTLKARDYETERHGERLQIYVARLGRAFKLTDSDIALLETLAEVHDIGKIGIPDSILLKPGQLTDKEWEIMRTHPEKGYRIASNSPDLMPVADLILKHHEHYDGSGYPFGLAGEDIPFLCRILAVCDAYDAMTSHRPYRAARTQEEAIIELRRCQGSQFDPEVVDCFIKAVLKQKTT